MATTVTKVGGTPSQPAYVSVDTDGTLEVSNGTTTNTLTSAILAALTKFSGYVWDASAAATGEAYVNLKPNLASAWAVKQSSTALLDFVTTTNKFRVKLGTLLAYNTPILVTVAANHTLVFGTAGPNQTTLTSNVVLFSNNTGGSLDCTLPATADIAGVPLHMINVGADAVVIKDASASTVVTLASGKGAIVHSNGTNCAAIAGA